jgi:hypothetical protein
LRRNSPNRQRHLYHLRPGAVQLAALRHQLESAKIVSLPAADHYWDAAVLSPQYTPQVGKRKLLHQVDPRHQDAAL